MVLDCARRTLNLLKLDGSERVRELMETLKNSELSRSTGEIWLS